MKSFLSFLHSPQESEKGTTLVTAEVLIECLRDSQINLVNALKMEIEARNTIFDPKYFKIQYSGKQRECRFRAH